MMSAKESVINDIIENAIYIAWDNNSNFGDTYIEEQIAFINEDLGYEKYEIEDLIKDITKDNRVASVGGCTDDYVIDIILTDECMENYNKKIGDDLDESL